MKVCGLDVHKDTIFCAIYNGKKYEEVKIFSTVTRDIHSLSSYLKEEQVVKVAMESTGIYWMPIWNILEKSEFELLLVNPYYIKQMPGRKSDVKDAQWIAKLLYRNMLRGSFVPDEKIRELRAYTRKEVKLQGRRTSLLQELERILEQCNIRITSFTSTIDSKSVRDVIELIIEGTYDPDVLIGVIHGRIKNRHGDKVLESLDGVIPDHKRYLLEMTYEEFLLVESHIEKLNVIAEELCNSYYKKEMELLKSVSGVSTKSAIQFIAEAGADMNTFEDSKKFASWIGFSPRNDESAGKFKSRATTKGNRYLRRTLVQIAWAASRTKGSYFNHNFKRLTTRKGPRKSLIANARKIAVIMWNIIKYRKVFNPELLPIYDPVNIKKKLDYYKSIVDNLQGEIERQFELSTSII